MKRSISVLLAIVMLGLTISVRAHHSQVTFFFMEETVEVTGVVKELRIINPHGVLLLEATDENGGTVLWTIQSSNAASMRGDGWTPTTLLPGEAVTVVGHPARNRDVRGMYGSKVIKADGTEIVMGGE